MIGHERIDRPVPPQLESGGLININRGVSREFPKLDLEAYPPPTKLPSIHPKNRLYAALKFCKKRSKEKILQQALEKTIYLLRCESYYKIGFSNDMHGRMSSYRVHNPFETLLISHAKTQKFKEYEDWIHENFFNKFHHGEWYKFDEKDLQSIKTKWFDALEKYVHE